MKTPEPLVVVVLGDKLIAVHAHTGQRRWQHVCRDPADRLEVDEHRVVALSHRQLSCLDLHAGTLLWQTELPMMGTGGTLLIHAGVVLVAVAGELAGFAADSGTLLWHDPFKGYGVRTMGIAARGASAQLDRIR